MWLFLPFVGYVINYMIFLEILFSSEQNKLDQDPAKEYRLKVYTGVTQALLFVWAVYFLQLHIR